MTRPDSHNLLLLLAICFHAAMATAAPDNGDAPLCPVKKVEVERLPDLNVARYGHALLFVDGEAVVLGGHTHNFVPTPTAEFFRNGRWQQEPMAYAHDNGFTLTLQSGKILIMGGHEQHLGIGQTFVTELYDPATRTFQGFGGLDVKRCLATATELDSGRIVIAGNWYHADSIEVFDGHDTFTAVRACATSHRCPHVLRTAPDDAIIFGSYDAYGKQHNSPLVDRLKGEAYVEPLLEQWHLIGLEQSVNDGISFIGDAAAGDYAYLISAVDSCGQQGIILVRNGIFSLLPTACPLPMHGPWGPISYTGRLVADRSAQRAYHIALDDEQRFYFLSIAYADTLDGGAPLTLYYTDPLPWAGCEMPAVLPGGDLLMAGGFTGNNFAPSASAFILRLGNEHFAATHSPASWRWLMTALVLVAVILAAIFFVRLRHRRRTSTAEPASTNEEKKWSMDNGQWSMASRPSPCEKGVVDDLLPRICALMDEQQLFLNSELKVSDVAAALGTNSDYVSRSIKAGRDCSFVRFVNGYRVDYAQRLMRTRPDDKMSAVCLASGFANESSFFRTFKAVTGMTPAEWKAKTTDKSENC